MSGDAAQGNQLAPTGTVALVFTDVEGSTQLWDRAPEVMRGALDVHDAIMRAGIERHGGYEVKTEGDAFMVAFASAGAAVAWCLDTQRALLEAPWPEALASHVGERPPERGTPWGGLAVRMGIHVGDPDCRPSPLTGRMDYFGPTVNRAARVASAGHGGQVLASHAVQVMLGGAWIDLGVHRLKGLTEPERLWQLPPPGLEGRRFPAVKTERVRRGNVSAAPGSFLGRRGELGALGDALASARLVTLTGPGGAGKTRLARELAWRQLDVLGGAGGVWWVDLSDVEPGSGAVGAAAALAAALGVPLTANVGALDAAQAVAHALAARGATLAVCDNFDRLVAVASDTVARWLEAAPEARFLVTSRERLGVGGEHVVELTPLSPEAGAELFLERARAASPSFRAGAAERAAALEISTRLDGLPLALELAAARARVLSPTQILTRLERRFELLGGARGGRHATLRASIDGSWELLGPAERAAMAQCAVFRGDFTLEAAEAVLVLPDGAWALGVVEALRDKSLLAPAIGGSQGGAPRFRLLESLHAYALERLAEASADGTDAAATSAATGAALRHADHYVGLGEALAARVRGPGGADALAELAADADQLAAVCERSQLPAALRVRAALALDALLAVRGPVELEHHLLDAAVTSAESATPPDPVLLARTLLARARARVARGELGAAEADLARALPLAEAEPASHATQLLQSHICCARGTVTRTLGRPPEAAGWLQRALELAGVPESAADSDDADQGEQRQGDDEAGANALDALAALEQDRSELGIAKQLAARAIRRVARLGDRRTEGRLRQNLAGLYQDAGELAAARALYQEALVLVRAVGDVRLEGIVLANMGNLCGDEGHADDARARLAEALELLAQVGDRRFLGHAHMYLGLVELWSGSAGGALLERARELHRAVGARRFAALDRGYLALGGLLASRSGAPADAISELCATAEELCELDDRGLGAYFSACAGAAARRTGDLEAAAVHHARAAALAASLAAPPTWLPAALAALAGPGVAAVPVNTHQRLAFML
ncbi:MAG: hypothetical protein IT370_36565 [Deltaproteobacteria bacterium]|nr:hypothetical protein [Deltaproteobacteria bacterium]